jgi:predicted DsbA family dithiol-disulfide isomerase
MEKVRVSHFSDVLCVWAYVSQVRCDELIVTYPLRVSIESRFCSVFGDARRKLEKGWADRGGLEAYAEHVRHIVDDFGHLDLHPDVWRRCVPASSMPAHLYACAVRLLESRGELEEGSAGRALWALRLAFFAEAADVSSEGVLRERFEALDLPWHAVAAVLASGEAHAELSRDLELARDQSVRASPTLLFNEGRQRLTGNVGYRILEANVRELLDAPASQHSWC